MDCRQQDWFFAGYRTDSRPAGAVAAAVAAVMASEEEDDEDDKLERQRLVNDDLAGRNVEVLWAGNDQWYRGQICAQMADRRGRRLVKVRRSGSCRWKRALIDVQNAHYRDIRHVNM